MAVMAALISSKVWFLFIALTVVVVLGSPTTDLLETVNCLLRDCVRYFTNADRINDRFSYSLNIRRFCGKGERWKRKRQRAETERPSKLSSPVAP